MPVRERLLLSSARQGDFRLSLHWLRIVGGPSRDNRRRKIDGASDGQAGVARRSAASASNHAVTRHAHRFHRRWRNRRADVASFAEVGEHEVVGVVTQPDKPVGRSQLIEPPPIKKGTLRSQDSSFATGSDQGSTSH